MHKEEAENTKDSIAHNKEHSPTSPQHLHVGDNIRPRQKDLVPGPTPHVLTFCLLHSLHTHLFIRNSWSLLSLGALHVHAEVGRGSLIVWTIWKRDYLCAFGVDLWREQQKACDGESEGED